MKGRNARSSVSIRFSALRSKQHAITDVMDDCGNNKSMPSRKRNRKESRVKVCECARERESEEEKESYRGQNIISECGKFVSSWWMTASK